MPARPATYLDSNAGEVVSLQTRERISLLLREGLLPNSFSQHGHGRRARAWWSEARDQIAKSLGVKAPQLRFAGSGSEANQWIVRSVLENSANPHWVTSPVEHSSVLKMQNWVRKRGGKVTLLPVDGDGRIAVEHLAEIAASERVDLVTLIWVGNETGAITDVEGAWSLASRLQIPLHLDGAQAWGKLRISTIPANFAAFSAHKIGALAGTGIVFEREPGGLGARSGTENLVGIVAAGEAATQLDAEAYRARLEPMRARLEQSLIDLPGARINSRRVSRVANTVSATFSGVDGRGLVEALDLAGFSVSSGSACESGAREPSHVLQAMGLSRDEALATIRISFSRETQLEDLELFTQALPPILERLRTA